MAKTDMERIGLFSELGYTTIKDPYVSAFTSKLVSFLACQSFSSVTLHAEPFNESASKDKQMLIEGAKSKTAFQDGYFSKKFDRVMEVSLKE